MKNIFLLCVCAGLFTACSSTDTDPENPNATYNREALLAHWADDIIIPSYANYQQSAANLVNATATFTALPNEANLTDLRTAWFAAYKAYQATALYAFAKAESDFYKESSNTYPTNTAGIQANVLSGNYNLSLFSQYDKQGFPALDYLLYGLANSDAEILAFYTVSAQSAGYKQYLNAVSTRLFTNVTSILDDWNSGYRNTYVASTGTTVSSAVNKTTNSFVKNLEKDVRTAKLSTPAGELSNGATFPEKVEAYYSGTASKQMLIFALKASQDFFNGRSFGALNDGLGLKDYLNHVGAVRSGTPLGTTINNQYTATISAVEALNDNLAQQIASNNTVTISALAVLQQNVIYVKLDMMQALNITIDYVDGDGD